MCSSVQNIAGKMIDAAANNLRALPLVCEECKLVSLTAAQFTTVAGGPSAAYKNTSLCTFIEALAQRSRGHCCCKPKWPECQVLCKFRNRKYEMPHCTGQTTVGCLEADDTSSAPSAVTIKRISAVLLKGVSALRFCAVVGRRGSWSEIVALGMTRYLP